MTSSRANTIVNTLGSINFGQTKSKPKEKVDEMQKKILTKCKKNVIILIEDKEGFDTMTFLMIFVGLSIVNVVFSTVRSILTIKGGKVTASLLSGGYFAFYNIMLIYTVADFPMWQKCLITFTCNVIGVFIVKLAEEKMRKDKLWKVEATLAKENNWEAVIEQFKTIGIPCNYIDIDKYILVKIGRAHV